MVSSWIIALTSLIISEAAGRSDVSEVPSTTGKSPNDGGAAAAHRHRSLIIDGHDAPVNKYPYFASLDHFAGGVLIAPDIVLTAGHVHPPLEQHVQVRLNHSHFPTTANFTSYPIDSEIYSIIAIVQHPDYYTISSDENVNDFALFVLDRCSTIPPVLLNRKANIPRAGQMVKVVGMGSTSPDPTTLVQTAATKLQEVELEVLSHHECVDRSGDPKHRPHVSYKGRIYDDCMICTSGGRHNEKDACAFDSGSPLIVKNRWGQPRVVGLVSWGEHCADPYFPAVNARVSFAMDWIDATVCALSKADPSQLADFRCDELDDDDDDYYFRGAEFIRPHDYSNYRHNNGGSAGRRSSKGADPTRDSANARGSSLPATANSGLNAMMVLVAAGSVALALVILRLQHRRGRPPMRRLSSITSSTRGRSATGSNGLIFDERLLSKKPAQAFLERAEDHSPDESLKTYDTFSGQSI